MIYFRNDDVSPSSNYHNITECYNVLKSNFPTCKIYSGITLFSKYNKVGSVYSEIPFKDKDIAWFYNVDKFINEIDYINKEDICSHGLFHVNHSKLSKDAQEMSILSSCKFLRTDKFIAPFNAYNLDTINVCLSNNIHLITAQNYWKSLEFEKFDPSHRYWYFHSWRWNKESLSRVFDNAKFI